MTKKEAIKELQETHGMMQAYNIDSSESILMTAINVAIEALEQEPCEDAISREELLKKQYRIDDSATLSTRDVVDVEDIEDLPSVTPKDDVLGKIRAEIENDWQLNKYPSSPFSCGLRRAIEIIDKYKDKGVEE